MGNLKDQLKQQGLISSFGQPLGSSTMEDDCYRILCTGCTGCTSSCTLACSVCVIMSGC
jgi:hypothetical protein